MLEPMLLNMERYRLASYSAAYFPATIIHGEKLCVHQHDINNPNTMKLLFDTGAMCANYISKDTFEEVKHRIPPENIIKKKNRIKLADNATVLQSNKAVILKLIISDDLGNTTTYSGEFVVIDMKYKELIVGFPAITTDLWSFFTSALETRRSLSSAPQHIQLKSGQVYSVSNADTLFYPWQQGDLSIEAPEDRDTPHPAQFSEYQAFLGKTREEALSEFLSLFDEHIDPEFRKATPIDRLLREKGVLLFVPKEWEGISGIPKAQVQRRIAPSYEAQGSSFKPQVIRACRDRVYTPQRIHVCSFSLSMGLLSRDRSQSY